MKVYVVDFQNERAFEFILKSMNEIKIFRLGLDFSGDKYHFYTEKEFKKLEEPSFGWDIC